jgi:hypothetical protein
MESMPTEGLSGSEQEGQASTVVSDGQRDEENQMKDFFISYNNADKDWAEWIAWILEESNYSVVIQAWDFRPGANFVWEMHKAATETHKTIAVLSKSYLNAEYTHSEWAAAFTRDPRGQQRTLIPIRVRECKPTGLLASHVYVNLVGLSEHDARMQILGAFSGRAKPPLAPTFPGASGGMTQVAPERVIPNRVQYPADSITVSVNEPIIPTESVNTPLTAPVQSHHTPPGTSHSLEERLALMKKLNALPASQFNMLISILEPPAGLIPPMPANQIDRVVELLTWAKSPGGRGLSQVQQVLERILDHQ